MVETLKRQRENLARVALAISAVYIVISLVKWGYLVAHGVSMAEASHTVGGSSLSVVMVLAVLASVLACIVMHPATPNARRLVRLGATVVGLAAALEAVFTLVGLFRSAGGILGGALEVLGAVLEIGVKLAAATVLWRTSASSRDGIESSANPALGEKQPTQQTTISETTAPRQQASWTADQAAGAVWTRAGDAASGAAASTWGHPGSGSSGWNVAPAQPELTAGGAGSAAAGGTGAAAGPWATAGQLASGERAGSDAGPTASGTAAAGLDEPAGGAPRSAVDWTPAAREPRRVQGDEAGWTQRDVGRPTEES